MRTNLINKSHLCLPAIVKDTGGFPRRGTQGFRWCRGSSWGRDIWQSIYISVWYGGMPDTTDIALNGGVCFNWRDNKMIGTTILLVLLLLIAYGRWSTRHDLRQQDYDRMNDED